MKTVKTLDMTAGFQSESARANVDFGAQAMVHPIRFQSFASIPNKAFLLTVGILLAHLAG